MDDAGPPRVVVASDAFKGSLTSLEVADAVRLGLLDVVPSVQVDIVAMADGGEGTVAAALTAGWVGVAVDVSGPTGEPVRATLAVSRRANGMAAVVELADACGLGRLPGGIPAPLTASSRGLGEAVRGALELGAEEVIIGLGGSASTDGGAGMLVALGARVLGVDGRELPDGGAALADLARLDLSGLDPRLATTRLVLAADVDSPLLGPTGAAAAFGPQKGATRKDVIVLETGLRRWADVVAHTGPGTRPADRATSPRPGAGDAMPAAGAAGGVGFALLAVLGAERRPGVEFVLDLVGLDSALPGSDLVVTGEGALDQQTLAGKAVAGVTRRASAHGIPVVAVCGRLDLDAPGLTTLGVRAAYPLSDLEGNPDRSLAHAPELLRRNGRRIARDWLSPTPG